MSRIDALMLLTYALLMAAMVTGLLTVRSRVLRQTDPESSRQDWEEWRTEAARQAVGDGPVARRAPAATEAPTVLLMRDHFAACLTLATVISTVLFATLALMLRGVVLGPKLEVQQDGESDPVP